MARSSAACADATPPPPPTASSPLRWWKASAANPEDRAVDLYVLERAMASTHPGSDVRLVPRVMEAYRRTCRSGHYQTMEKLAQVRLRGRKRLAFG